MIGSHIGSTVGIPLEYLAKKWGEDKGLVYISAIARKAAKEGPEAFSTILSAEAQQRLEATMQGVKKTVQSMAQRATLPDNLQNFKSGLYHMLDGNTQGLSEPQQLKKIGEHLTRLNSNPATMVEATTQLAAPMRAVNPTLANAYQEQLMRSYQYLYQAMPQNPVPPAPFAPNLWQPSPTQNKAFRDKLEIAANPMIAMREMHRGTLTPDHIDALNTMYPSVLQMMRDEIMKFHAAHPDVLLPSQERASVSRFLQAPTDPLQSPEAIQALQKTYASPQQQPQATKPFKRNVKNMPSQASAFSQTQSGPTDQRNS